MHVHKCYRTTFATVSAFRTRGSPVASTTAAAPFASALRTQQLDSLQVTQCLPYSLHPCCWCCSTAAAQGLKSALGSRPSCVCSLQ